MQNGCSEEKGEESESLAQIICCRYFCFFPQDKNALSDAWRIVWRDAVIRDL